jgi:hypothetical protein
MSPPKPGDRAVIWAVHRRHRDEVDPFLARLRDLARGVHTAAVCIKQKRQHHRGMIRRITALLGVGLHDLRQIEVLANRIAHKMRHVPDRDQLMDRQQHPLLKVPRSKRLAHAPL